MSLTAWAQEEKAKRESWYENDRLRKRIAELERERDEMYLELLFGDSSSEINLEVHNIEQQAKAIKAALNDFMCDEYSTQVYVADLDRRVDELTRRAAKLKG